MLVFLDMGNSKTGSFFGGDDICLVGHGFWMAKASHLVCSTLIFLSLSSFSSTKVVSSSFFFFLLLLRVIFSWPGSNILFLLLVVVARFLCPSAEGWKGKKKKARSATDPGDRERREI